MARTRLIALLLGAVLAGACAGHVPAVPSVPMSLAQGSIWNDIILCTTTRPGDDLLEETPLSMLMCCVLIAAIGRSDG